MMPNADLSQPPPDEERLIALLQGMRPHPTGRYYQRMASAPWRSAPVSSSRIARIVTYQASRTLLAVAALIFFLTITMVLAVPSLSAVARQLMRFFIPNPSDNMVLQVTVPSPGDAQVFGSEGYFSLTLSEVEKLAGYDVKEILLPEAGSPLPRLVFSGAHYDPGLEMVTLRYSIESDSLFFSQHPSGNIEEYSSIGAGAPVETVRVRGVEGEYVRGGWRSEPSSGHPARQTPPPGTQVSLDITWDPALPQRILRWQEDHVYYEILISAGLGRKMQMEKEALINLANFIK
jgi:hypothetical protein